LAPDNAVSAELSTAQGVDDAALVDDFVGQLTVSPGQTWRLGMVLPKKQARRSVTRSLIRHQVRESLRRHAGAVLDRGAYGPDAVDGWVVRLRAPFDRQRFPSAASDALKALVRQELDELWLQLGKPASAGGRSASRSAGAAVSSPRGAA
jgi:ribonuclease P protein component